MCDLVSRLADRDWWAVTADGREEHRPDGERMSAEQCRIPTAASVR